MAQNTALTIQLDNARLANQELEDQVGQRDTVIADLTKACARYKSDCESFAAKALEWKQKFDHATAGHAAQDRKIAVAKTRALEKRIAYVAEEMANTGGRAGIAMDYSIYVVPEGDEDEANIERCETMLSGLQKELKKVQERLKGESALQDELVHCKAAAVAAQRDVDDMKAKLMALAKSHCDDTADAIEKIALLDEALADLAAQTHALDRQCMVTEDFAEQINRLGPLLAKLRFDKQLLGERYAALQATQLESQQRLDDLDETKARMKQKIHHLKGQLADATDAQLRNADDIGMLDLSVAHAALQAECMRLQDSVEEKNWLTTSQAVVIGVLQSQLDQVLNAHEELHGERDHLQPSPTRIEATTIACASPTRQFGPLQYALYETAIQVYMDEIKVLREDCRVLKAQLVVHLANTEPSVEAAKWTHERQTLVAQVEQLKQDVEQRSEQLGEFQARVGELEDQLSSTSRSLEASQSALEAETLKCQTTKAQLETTTALTHELAAQVKQFPNREDKLRSVIQQLQEHEAASDEKAQNLESTIHTLEQTVLVLQGEAEASIDEISKLLEQQKTMQAALTQSKMETTTLHEVVQKLQTGTTQLQTIMEQDKEDLVDGYEEEVKHLQKRVLGLTKRCEDCSAQIQDLQLERDAALAKLSGAEATTAASAVERQEQHGALKTQIESLEGVVEAKTKEIAQWQHRVTDLEAIVSQLQAEKAQYKTEVHAIEALLHETSPLQQTVDALQNDTKQLKVGKSPSKHGKQPGCGSPKELKHLRQRVKELELEKDLLVAEVEQVKASNHRDGNVAFYVAQVDGLEEKLSEQTAMYLSSVKQAQAEYKDLETQYQAKIRHLEMELQLDEARIEALEGRLAESLSHRSVATTPMRRGRR
ncbi:hypothetical protein DYB32_005506 [Aphanomyces invadans]|uniref:Uncharacterized protein n=1 Tax=Aphanomyces invadans TaxID=157072 RepID=A0A418AUC4_9STRA|nr:hypothetical protein DYB32_005506 [Aphanomyces invadans]